MRFARILFPGRHDHAEASRLNIMIVLSSKPKESPVLDDWTAETATKEVIRIVWFRNAGLLAEKVILLRPNRPRLKETRAVKVVGSRF